MDENFNEKIQVTKTSSNRGHLNTPFGSPTRGEQNTKKSHAPGKEMLRMQVTRKMPSRGRPSNVWILCWTQSKKALKNTRKIKTMWELWWIQAKLGGFARYISTHTHKRFFFLLLDYCLSFNSMHCNQIQKWNQAQLGSYSTGSQHPERSKNQNGKCNRFFF